MYKEYIMKNSTKATPSVADLQKELAAVKAALVENKTQLTETKAQLTETEEAAAATKPHRPTQALVIIKNNPIFHTYELAEKMGLESKNIGSIMSALKLMKHRWLKDVLPHPTIAGKKVDLFVYMGKMSDEQWVAHRVSLTPKVEVEVKVRKKA